MRSSGSEKPAGTVSKAMPDIISRDIAATSRATAATSKATAVLLSLRIFAD